MCLQQSQPLRRHRDQDRDAFRSWCRAYAEMSPELILAFPHSPAHFGATGPSHLMTLFSLKSSKASNMWSPRTLPLYKYLFRGIQYLGHTYYLRNCSWLEIQIERGVLHLIWPPYLRKSPHPPKSECYIFDRLPQVEGLLCLIYLFTYIIY